MNCINRNKSYSNYDDLKITALKCNRLHENIQSLMDITLLERSHKANFPQLFIYVNLFVKNKENAENLIEDIFVSIYEKQIFNLSDEQLTIYLFKACRKKLVEVLKPKNLHHIEFLIFGQPIVHFFSSEMNSPDQLFMNKLHLLSYEQREIVILRYHLKKEVHQIAQIIGKTPVAVVRSLELIVSKLDQYSHHDA